MLSPMASFRILSPGQRCRILIFDLITETTTLVHETTRRLYEAPNWTAHDELILNGEGLLWRIDATPDAVPTAIVIDGVHALNNDHVLGPDGRTVYLSAVDG